MHKKKRIHSRELIFYIPRRTISCEVSLAAFTNPAALKLITNLITNQLMLMRIILCFRPQR
jgi:hypothetical protein